MSVLTSLKKLNALRSLQRGLPAYQRVSCSTKSFLEYEKDPQPMFLDPETQSLLKSMTQLKLDKVFKKDKVPDNSSEYKFMTTEELELEFKNAIAKAQQRLQMPPIVKMKTDTTQIISKDPGLTSFSDTKYVFTDITYGVRQSERKVVIRQLDGTLEHAPMDVTKRMRQIYFPLEGRKIRVPRMFEDEHLKRCLDEHKYEFILDRLTVQFEPYEPDFHIISSKVYQHLMESKQFDLLRSTRHFGPMAFFYAWHKCIDDLLYDMIKHDYLRNGVELIALMYKIHGTKSDVKVLLQKLNDLQPVKDLAKDALDAAIGAKTDSKDIQKEINTAIGKTRNDFEADDLCLDFIEHYIKEHGLKKVQLELALQTLKEINNEKRQLFDGLTKAHGVQ